MDKYEVIKFKDDEFEMDVNVSPNEDTVWLTKEQIALLYDRDRSVISRHIKKIYFEGELNEKSTCAKNAQILDSRERIYESTVYNLDVIISVGYRVKSKRGVLFRKWANKVLKQYLLNGYVIKENRVVVSNENFIKLSNEVVSINNRLIKIEDKVHDRYIIIDQIKLYHLGASIKDLGKRIFSINELHQDNMEGLLARI